MKELDRKHYARVLPLLMQVKINNLFARSVVEKHVEGKVYVNDVLKPTTCYIVHPYGMSLLLGSCLDDSFNRGFVHHALNLNRNRNSLEFMQVYPSTWYNKLNDLFGNKLVLPEENGLGNVPGIIELHARINYRFSTDAFFRSRDEGMYELFEIRPLDASWFNLINGTVVPSSYWRNSEHFASEGIGYVLMSEERPAAWAFSAFVHDHHIEIGVETAPAFRKKSLGRIVCQRLIDQCIVKHRNPVWACRKGNLGSCRLAAKLGFEHYVEIPYYKLSY